MADGDFTGTNPMPDDYPPQPPVFACKEMKQPSMDYAGPQRWATRIAGRTFAIDLDGGHPADCRCGLPFRPARVTWWENISPDPAAINCGDTAVTLMLEGQP